MLRSRGGVTPVDDRARRRRRVVHGGRALERSGRVSHIVQRSFGSLLVVLLVTACAADVPGVSRAELCAVAGCGRDMAAPVADPVLPPGTRVHPRLEVGVLSEPAPGAPAELVARALLEAPGLRWRLVRERPAGAGTLVRMQQTFAGHDVVGGEAAVRLDALGRARWLSSGAVSLDPAFDTEPELSASAALAVALSDPAPTLDPSRHTRLVVLADPALREPRLAWHVSVEDELAMATFRVYVDARTGEVLSRENRTRRAPSHRARVWDVSPAVSELEEVVFEDLPEGATRLADDDVELVNCIDEHRCHEVRTTVGLRVVHHCELRTAVEADPVAGFLHVEPPGDHAALEDAFSEVQLYHHVKTAMAAFRRWSGNPDFALRNRITAVANLRVPDLTSQVAWCEPGEPHAPADSRLLPVENAAFWPRGDIGPSELGDRVIFHQTPLADWAYDGETVYHEMVHALMYTLTPLAWRSHDELGVDYRAGGLHEGFSDYLAAAITGNARMSAYAGTTEAGPAPLNDLTKLVRCDHVLTGEEHEESEAWVGALWAIRRSLRSEQKREMFNGAILTVLAGLGQFDSFGRAHGLVLAELELSAEELVERGEIDEPGVRALEAALSRAPGHFEERGIPDCGGRVQTLAIEEPKTSLQLLGPNTWGLDRYRDEPLPAGMQLRVVLEEPTDALRVVVGQSAEYDDTLKPSVVPDRPALTVLVRGGDRPIRWVWDGPVGTHDAEVVARLEVDDTEWASALGVVPGPFDAGVYHLQLANAGADWILYDIRIQAAREEGVFDAPWDRADPVDRAPVAGGCSVGAAPRSGSTSFSFLLWLALLGAGLRERFRSPPRT